jgi:DNA-binding PadR family transcriptional regulator
LAIKESDLMSLKHAILGFLSHLPMSGYDLKKAFDGSVRHFWPADQSQIYRTLSQLAEDGLVEREAAAGETHRDRHVYHITGSGLAELRNWLATPQPPADDREPFLIQVFFSANQDTGRALALLERQRDEIRQQYAFYEQLFEQVTAGASRAPSEKAFFFSTLTLEYVLALGHGYLHWLDAAIDRVRREDFAPQHPGTYLHGDM